MSIEPARARCGIGHRRSFLVASAALGASLLLPKGAAAAQVKVLQGDVRVNGKKASKTSAIRAGDTVETARGARVVFVLGEDAFLLRGDSKLMLERTSGGQTRVVTGLRLLSGALLAAFAPAVRRIETPTATAGIRGTAVYVEASKEQTYFCTCYGVVELRDKAGMERKTVISGYHTPNMVFANPAERGKMAEAEVKGHTDEELIMLERLAGRTSPLVKRNQKIKEASQPESVEQPTSPEQSAAPKKEAQPDDKPTLDKSKSSSEPAKEETAPKKAAPEDKPAPPQKPGKKSRTQKQKPKPPAEAMPPETAPPEKAPAMGTPELGPSPAAPQEPPQPPPQEYRLPPPRLDN